MGISGGEHGGEREKKGIKEKRKRTMYKKDNRREIIMKDKQKSL